MDSKDRQIIRALQANARMTNQDLAAAVNLSPSPCLRRLRNLEDSGVIRGYSVDVDARAYGLPMTVFIRIRLERHTGSHIQEFEARIRAIEEVLECHLMTGPADYLLRVVVAGLDHYEDFIRNRIHAIGGIASIDTSIVYGTVKKTGVFPALPS
jgi:Lrp/AsnC family leucine-responsive transcriptional regulator